MNKQLQTVYIPKEKGTTDCILYKNLGTAGLESSNVEETQAYVFTLEELKELLSDAFDAGKGKKSFL